MASPTLRRRTYEILETATSGDRASLVFDNFIMTLILLNITAFVLETIPGVGDTHRAAFFNFELFSVFIFTIEYILRIWTAVEHLPYRKIAPLKARLKFMLHPFLIIDLLAILPFFLGHIFGLDLRILRVFRLFRFFKIVRYSPALQVLIKVFYNEGRALIGALMIAGALLLFASTGIHFIEGDTNEAFKSIPHSMWWALATLTTVGYGDVVPKTPFGQMWGGLFMIFGLGLFALPIGIISTGFAREINRRDFVINWSMVSKVPFFHNLDGNEMSEIMQVLQSQKYPKGAIIVERGDNAAAMFFLASGEIHLEMEDDMRDLSAGDFFGEGALLAKETYNATATAMTDCDLLELDKDDFERLMRRNSKINNHIRQVATARMMGQWDLDEDDL